MASQKKRRFLVLDTGEEVEIVGEKSAYWICESSMFRKSNPRISNIVEKTAAKRAEGQIGKNVLE